MTKYRTHPEIEPRIGVDEVGLLARALSDESRLRVLLALRDSPALCVCQLTELLDLAPSTVSKHLSVLRQAGLVEAEKRGRWVYVRRADFRSGSAEGALLAWLDATVAEADTTVSSDCCRLDEILRIDPSELSARQS